MLLGTLHMRFDAGNLRLESGDAGVKLFHGNGVEILFGKGNQRVVRLAWEQIVEIHGRIV